MSPTSAGSPHSRSHRRCRRRSTTSAMPRVPPRSRARNVAARPRVRRSCGESRDTFAVGAPAIEALAGLLAELAGRDLVAQHVWRLECRAKRPCEVVGDAEPDVEPDEIGELKR